MLREAELRFPKHWNQISDIIIHGRACGICENKECESEHGKPHPTTGAKVVLKVIDCGDDRGNDSMKAFCQICRDNLER